MGFYLAQGITKPPFQHFENDSELDYFRPFSTQNMCFTGIVQCCAVFYLVVNVVLARMIQNKNAATYKLGD